VQVGDAAYFDLRAGCLPAPASRRGRGRAWRRLACAAAVAAALLWPRAGQAQLAQRFQHEGRLDFVHFANSMRTASNLSDPCDVSSSASITVSGIPSGATIVAAYLYWAGSGSADNTVTFAGQSTTGTTYTGSYSLSGTTFQFYGGRAVVTSRVSGNGTYTLSGMNAATTGAYCTSEAVVKGWSLLVIYSHSSRPLRRVTVFDGLDVLRSGSRTLSLGGFMAAPALDSRISLLTWEGDPTISGGEGMSFNGSTLGTIGDVFASGSDHGLDLSGHDVASLLPAGSRSATVEYMTGDDLILNQAAVTSLSIVTVDVTPKSSAVSRTAGRYSETFVVENTSLASDDFNLRATRSGSPLFVQIDSIRGTGVLGGTGDSVRVRVPAQSTRTYRVWYTVPSGAAATNVVTLTARSVTYPGVPQATSAGSATITRVQSVIDLAISKTSSSSFTPGSNGTYTIRITNEGTAPSSGAMTVRDTMPAGVTAVGMTGSGWTAGASGTTSDGRTFGDLVYAGTLAAGASATATITVQVTLDAAPSVTNTAHLSGGGDQSPNDNSSSVTTPVNAPDLSIHKAGPPVLTPGGSATYTITVRNDGNRTASGLIVVRDTLPDGLTYAGYGNVRGFWIGGHSGGVFAAVLWGSLAPGDSAVLSLDVDVAPTATGLIVNRAHVENSGQGNPANDSSSAPSASGQPSISVVVSVSPPAPVQPGQLLTYEVFFTNSGNATAVAVVVTDELSPDVDFQLGSTSASLPVGVTAIVEYFDGSSWSYAPESAGCGAPAGFDRCVRAARWVLQSGLAPGAAGTGWLRARVR